MQKLVLALALAITFIVGVLASDLTRSVARMFVGNTHPQCIDGRVCVGTEAPRVFGLLDDDRHGLTALFCDDQPNPNYRWIFLDGVVRGDRCPGLHFTVELRNATTRTTLKIANGRLVEITEESLHSIDL